MTVVFKDVLDNIDDLCQNYNVTNIDKGNKIRQANRAIEYMQRRLGLPSDKKTFSFYYYEDTPFYDCPTGFNEFIQLYYDDSNLNKPANRWQAMKDTEINNNTSGYQCRNKVAPTFINSKNQLLLSGHNQHGSTVINGFDSLSGLTFSSDISNAVIDNNIYVTSNASLKFDTNNTLSASNVTMTGTWNIQPLFNANTAFRLNVWFPDDNLPTDSIEQFSLVEIRFQSSPGNYYSMTTTNQINGQSWAIGQWNLIGWKLSDYMTTGSPDSTQITSVQIIFNHSALYIGVANMRIDNLYQISPDLMICAYYSAYKGTDVTGATPKINLDTGTDICYFGEYAQDLISPIALRATVLLFPQLRGDMQFYQMYNAEMQDSMKIYGRTYPHQRATGIAGRTEILR